MYTAIGAGWVAVWMPFEYFLYDGWPFQQNMRIYQQIADADIVIKESQGVGATHLGARERVGDST